MKNAASFYNERVKGESGIKINIPEDARYILKTLEAAGYEAYVVGGCVRDSVLGAEPEDWDITTDALPAQVKKLFTSTVDTGLKHGTVTVIRGGRGYEVTTYRIDGEYKDGRHPESVSFTRSLEEDLKRRDFTINAFAYNDERGLVDLFGGLEDLENGVVRAVGDPEKRFAEDALRTMRAVRFAAKFSFRIDDATWNAIGEFAEKLSLVSVERKRVELEKTLFSANPSYVNKFRELGLSEYITPQFYEACFDTESERIYERIQKDVSLDIRERKYLLLAAFFKNLSADECKKCMKKMTFDGKTFCAVSDIIRYKDDMPDEPRPAVKRAMRDMGVPCLKRTLKYTEAEKEPAKNPAGEKSQEKKIAEIIDDIIKSKEAYTVKDLAVSGGDIIGAGFKEGTAVGAELNRLLDMVIEDPSLNEKDKLLGQAGKDSAACQDA